MTATLRKCGTHRAEGSKRSSAVSGQQDRVGVGRPADQDGRDETVASPGRRRTTRNAAFDSR